MKTESNQAQILSIAESLIQTKGYNAFSYRDITEEMDIKTSSIHYYFPTKADLGIAVVKRHLQNLAETLNPIIMTDSLSFHKKLAKVIDTLIALTYGDHQKMCLGGILASDVLTLPEILQKEVRSFFSEITKFLKQLLTYACERNEITLNKDQIATEANYILSLFEGSLLLARLFKDEKYLAATKKEIIARYTKD